MKKLSALLIILLSMFVGRGVLNMNHGEVGMDLFSVNQYSNEIADYSSKEVLGEDRYLGEVKDSKVAAESAMSIWLEVYGESIRDEKPYHVWFDTSDEIWLVSSSGHQEGGFGGAAYAIIQKRDGKVLAIWHTK